MSRRLSTALLFATAITLLPASVHAGLKSGVSVHAAVVPNIHPIVRHVAPPASPVSQLGPGTHGKALHKIHKFSHHHHKRVLGWGLPFTAGEVAVYGPYYVPADAPGDVDPVARSGPFPG